MSHQATVKRIMRESRDIQLNPANGIHAHPLDNVFEWHFTIAGVKGTEFEGGRYHGKLILPSQYPFKPPDIIMLTKSGRFEIGKKICLNFSGYHPEQWQPSWTIRTMLTALRAFMVTPAGGAIGAIETSKDLRKRYAKLSLNYICPKCNANMKTIKFKKMDDENDKQVKESLDMRKATNDNNNNDTNNTNTNTDTTTTTTNNNNKDNDEDNEDENESSDSLDLANVSSDSDDNDNDNNDVTITSSMQSIQSMQLPKSALGKIKCHKSRKSKNVSTDDNDEKGSSSITSDRIETNDLKENDEKVDDDNNNKSNDDNETDRIENETNEQNPNVIHENAGNVGNTINAQNGSTLSTATNSSGNKSKVLDLISIALLIGIIAILFKKFAVRFVAQL